VIDLLDDNFQWQGGTRLRLSAGTGIVTTSFALVHPLTDL
jgi:hypothetical protein